jgi:alkaline phosphatase D
VATEFVGGSITSPGLGEGGGDVVPGANPRNPKTPQAIIDLLLKTNPWVKNADPDHHGYGLVEAGPKGLKCSFRRVPGVQKRSGARLPLGQFTYRLAKGQKSIL